MIPLDISTPTTTIIFECNDFRRNTGLLLLKQNNNNEYPDKFELHLHDDYTNNAIAIVLDIKDLVNMFDSLQDYFLQQ